jgi:hypothetical protein
LDNGARDLTSGRPKGLRELLLAGAVLATAAAALAIASPAASAACPNEAFRTGPSAHLPDCRAYELVTPPKLNTFPKSQDGSSQEIQFTSPSVVPAGDRYLFTTIVASVPGTESTGYENRYEARRSEAGWVVSRKSPTSLEAVGPKPGSYSENYDYEVFELEPGRGGSLEPCGSCSPVYVRYPDGSFQLLGEGTVPTGSDTDGFENGVIDDPSPTPKWFSSLDGGHQIFYGFAQLTPEAPAEVRNRQVYDRTGSGLKLISLLPGDVPPTAESYFGGSSQDGSTTLFLNSGNLYARLDNSRTIEIASGIGGEILPGGVNADGSRAFFVQAGNISVYDFGAEEASPVASPGDAILVNVSPDGSHAYFVSRTEIIPGEGLAGSPNLYVWDGTSIKFIATVTESDLVRSEDPFVGLALWTKGFNQTPAAENSNRSLNTARTTPDGRIFVFESSAPLTGYANEGHIEIFRYDTVSGELTCVSCSPMLSTAGADNELVYSQVDGVQKASQMLEMDNLSSDGQQVVFESLDSLLPQDVNGVRDVYEWRDGTLSLISTGTASQPSALMAITPSGSDIFVLTGQRLVSQGQETGNFAVYDARIDGGLAGQQTPQTLDCQGEACQVQANPPSLPRPGSEQLRGKGNLKPTCHRHRHRHARGAKTSTGKPKAGKHRKACRPKRRRAGK